MNINKTAILYWLIMLASSTISAQQMSIFDAMSHKDILKASLKTNITLLKTNKKLTESLSGTFTYENAQKKTIEIPVEVEMRGKFRRKVCEFPPLKIKFSKKGLAQSGLDSTHRSLKLVVHCKADEQANELLLREYLAYKIYNLLTGRSFRVQLVEMTYIDEAANNAKITMYAFFLEDSDQMATRLNGEICECHGSPKDSILTPETYTMLGFEYMIGNTDWSISMLRNVKIVQDRKTHLRTIVPYDFDFSGLVMAPYTTTDVNNGLKNPRDRILLRQDVNNYDLQQTTELFLRKKNLIYNYINNFTPLNEDARADVRHYLNTFYHHIEKNPTTWHEAPLFYEVKR